MTKIKILIILLIDKVEMKVKLNRAKGVILYKILIHNDKFYYFTFLKGIYKSISFNYFSGGMYVGKIH